MPEKYLNDWKSLTDDDLITQLMPDPNNPDINVVVGVFLGSDLNEKMVRLYTTLQLNQYFQIPKDKILGAKRFPSERIAIWIPGDLKIQLTTSNTLSGDFLKGNFLSAYSRGARTAGLGSVLTAMLAAGPGGGTSFFPGCQSNDTEPVCHDTLSPNLCNPQPPLPTGCRC